MDKIAAEFEAIERDTKPRVKVGIVGEIYIKYSALGNNNLERFLASENCEVMVPGLLDFMLYCVQGGIEAYDLYGGEKMPLYVCRIARRYLERVKSKIISAASAHGFTPAVELYSSDKARRRYYQPRLRHGRGMAAHRRDGRAL